MRNPLRKLRDSSPPRVPTARGSSTSATRASTTGEPVREFEDLDSARAWRDRLEEVGIEGGDHLRLAAGSLRPRRRLSVQIPPGPGRGAEKPSATTTSEPPARSLPLPPDEDLGHRQGPLAERVRDHPRDLAVGAVRGTRSPRSRSHSRRIPQRIRPPASSTRSASRSSSTSAPASHCERSSVVALDRVADEPGRSPSHPEAVREHALGVVAAVGDVGVRPPASS